MSLDYRSQCVWPPLTEPFATALHHAVDFIFHEVEPVGVVASGTIILGRHHRASDLDLYVIHLAPFRRRIQRYFHGVPAEIFINPPAEIRAYFADEDAAGRRLTAHMLATGAVVVDADPVVDALRSEARQWLGKSTSMSAFDRVSSRYTIASRLEDALDLLDSDETSAAMLLGEAVLAMLEYFCKAEHGRIPRRKDLLAEIAGEHPDLATHVTAFFRATPLAERAELACEIADRTLGARGFFEWDSGSGPVREV